jgi:prepilin-type N-terminal cleavage/methylation domain-containing protein
MNPSARATRGLTLIELVVVMGMIGVLLGMGLGLLSSLNLGERAAVGLVQNVIRSAHNSALASASPALVRFDPSAGTISAQGMAVIGTWHFESERMRGARQLDGAIDGGAIVADGFNGSALSFEGAPPGAHASVGIQSDPGFDLTDGFGVQCALRLEGQRGGRVLSIGGVVGLDVSDLGVLRAWMRPVASGSDGLPIQGGLVVILSEPGMVSARAWSRVRLEYDRRLLRLFVDGVEVARDERQEPVWRISEPLFIGDLRKTFGGSIDNLVVAAVVATEVVDLPEGCTFPSDVPALIAFNAEGHLDREVHSGPITLHVDFEDGRRNLIRVGMYGTVE